MDNQLALMALNLGGGLSRFGRNTGSDSPLTELNNQMIQGIQAQNAAKAMPKYLQLLQQLLGPDGSKGTFSKDGANITYPQGSDMLKSLLGEEEGNILKVPDGQINPSVKPKLISNTEVATKANPFYSGQTDFSPSDLAGLTPQDLSNALSGALNIQGMITKKGELASDMIYKEQMMAESKSRITAEEARTLRETPTIPIPEDPNILLTPAQYLTYKKMSQEDKTAAVKNFEFAQSSEGGSFKGNFMDFQDAAKTTHQKDYEKAVAGGYKGSFNKWLLEINKSSAVRVELSTKLTEKEAFNQLDAENYLSGGEITKDLNKHMSSDAVQNARRRVLGKSGSLEYKANLEKFDSEERTKFIESEIIARGGTITSSATKGAIKTLAIKWPSGRTKEFKFKAGETSSTSLNKDNRDSIMKTLRKANPGKSDKILEEYAKSKGYL